MFVHRQQRYLYNFEIITVALRLPLAIAIFLGYTKADETFIKVNLGGGPNG